MGYGRNRFNKRIFDRVGCWLGCPAARGCMGAAPQRMAEAVSLILLILRIVHAFTWLTMVLLTGLFWASIGICMVIGYIVFGAVGWLTFLAQDCENGLSKSIARMRAGKVIV
jgi:hypothetical protein